MTKLALYVPLHVKAGKEKEVAESLRNAIPLVNTEPGTVSWFAIQEGPSRFAIFETFDDEAGRDAHLNGPVATALMDEAKSGDLFEKTPEIHALEILADKLLCRHLMRRVAAATKCALYIPLQAKLGKEEEVVNFLRSALPLVNAEPDTVAWFAIQEGPSRFAIFGTFDDETGRDAHFNGKVAAALMENATTGDLFVGMPEIRKLGILGDKLPD
jgi:quinol monooxygenase YgiN